MLKVCSCDPIDNYSLKLTFDNGRSGIVSLGHILDKPAFIPLKDQLYFRSVKIDSLGGVYWPNGADISAKALENLLEP